MTEDWITPQQGAKLMREYNARGFWSIVKCCGFSDDTGKAPSQAAVDLGVAKAGTKTGTWFWSESFLRLMLKGKGFPGFEGEPEPAVTHRTASDLVRRAVGMLFASKGAWNTSGAHRNWDRDPAYRRAMRLQFEAVVTHVAEERGVQAALDEVSEPLDAILSALDRSHPKVARAAEMLGEAMGQLRSLTPDHPLVRYGILPSGYSQLPEAKAA